MTSFSTYDDLTQYMDALGLFSMDLGLGRMEAFWRAADMTVLPPVVHVVGTNGKGSTATFLESIVRSHGLVTGLFTSPHFVTPRERIRINGRMLTEEDWVRLGNRLMETAGGGKLTYFEFQTCLAMLACKEFDVDVAVMEAGLGGRFDATNVFEPQTTVFTPIAMDHEHVLGDTLEAIAADKAGAMHRGNLCVTAPQQPTAMEVLQRHAEAIGARLMKADDLCDIPGTPLGLHGPHQLENARLALAGWRVFAPILDVTPDAKAEVLGLKRAFIPGRMQRVVIDEHTVILDGAHNPHALEALATALDGEKQVFPTLVFGCMADKDMKTMLPLLERFGAKRIIVTQADWKRAATPDQLAEALQGKAEPAANMTEAMRSALAAEGGVLVCGSLYLLAEVYSLYPEFLDPQSDS